jgi:hypothetical protein
MAKCRGGGLSIKLFHSHNPFVNKANSWRKRIIPCETSFLWTNFRWSVACSFINLTAIDSKVSKTGLRLRNFVFAQVSDSSQWSVRMLLPCERSHAKQ